MSTGDATSRRQTQRSVELHAAGRDHRDTARFRRSQRRVVISLGAFNDAKVLRHDARFRLSDVYIPCELEISSDSFNIPLQLAVHFDQHTYTHPNIMSAQYKPTEVSARASSDVSLRPVWLTFP